MSRNAERRELRAHQRQVPMKEGRNEEDLVGVMLAMRPHTCLRQPIPPVRLANEFELGRTNARSPLQDSGLAT